MTEEFHKNPSGDIYRIMDESGLTLANLQRPDQSQTKTVQQIRQDMHDAFKKYIRYRDRKVSEIKVTKTTEEIQV